MAAFSPCHTKGVVVKWTRKNVLLFMLAAVVPGMGIAWLMKVAASKNDPYDADFKHYVFENFDKLKAEEQKWLQ